MRPPAPQCANARAAPRSCIAGCKGDTGTYGTRAALIAQNYLRDAMCRNVSGGIQCYAVALESRYLRPKILRKLQVRLQRLLILSVFARVCVDMQHKQLTVHAVRKPRTARNKSRTCCFELERLPHWRDEDLWP